MINFFTRQRDAFFGTSAEILAFKVLSISIFQGLHNNVIKDLANEDPNFRLNKACILKEENLDETYQVSSLALSIYIAWRHFNFFTLR